MDGGICVRTDRKSKLYRSLRVLEYWMTRICRLRTRTDVGLALLVVVLAVVPVHTVLLYKQTTHYYVLAVRWVQRVAPTLSAPGVAPTFSAPGVSPTLSASPPSSRFGCSTMSVGWLVRRCRSVCHYFLKGWEVLLLWSYRSTCQRIFSCGAKKICTRFLRTKSNCPR